MKIIKEETYRSKPLVNISDNMVRVTLTCTRNEWHEIKSSQKGIEERRLIWEHKNRREGYPHEK